MARLAYRSDVPYTVGLTGAPGAGKSTLTDGLISAVARAAGPSPAPEPVAQVGVLAVDPTSPFSGGRHPRRPCAHAASTRSTRPSSSAPWRPGVTWAACRLAVPDAVRLLGAAGIAVVIVETVGVGQMEVEIASAADTTVVVVTPGWGDSMQANKAGLLEVADVFVINKADRPGGREARRDLEQMLDLARPGAWRPEIVDTTATAGEGVAELWGAVGRHRAHLESRASWRRGGPTGWPRSCAGCCWPAAEARIDELAAGEEFTTRRQGAGRRRARPLPGRRPPAGRMSRRQPGPIRCGRG